MKSIINLINDFNKGNIRIANSNLNLKINQYKIFYISNQNEYMFDQDVQIIMKQSEVIIIDKFSLKDQIPGDNYNYIIGFQKTIIIINQNLLYILKNLFSCNSKLLICFLSVIKNNFDKNIDLKYNEIKSHSNFQEEILEFNEKLSAKPIFDSINAWNALKSSISGYLIMKSYLKISKDRIVNFFSNQNNPPISIQITNENEYIELKKMGIGFSFCTILIYHIEREELFVIKKQHSNIHEISKLTDREIENYSQIKHPFLPTFYGTFQYENHKALIIEFINGNTLIEIKKMKLSDDIKITILYQIMLVIEYLHNNNFIYRDLKPDNIMIDENKSAVLIDFDRMIKYNSKFFNEDHTANLASDFVDPETSKKNFSYEVDIYSIGNLIFYLMNNNRMPDQNYSSELYKFGNYPKMKELYERCTNTSKDERPTISELVQEFYSNFKSQILISPKMIENIQKFNSSSKKQIDLKDGSSKAPHSNYKKFLKNIYSKFNIQSIDCSIKDEKTQQLILRNLTEKYKFITYQVHELNKKDSQIKTVNAVFCVERYCFILYSIQKEFVVQALNTLKSVLINTGEYMDNIIYNDIQLVFQIISIILPEDKIVNLTFNSILTFLIRRYYYPSYLFEDKSFFFFEQNIDAENYSQIKNKGFDKQDFLSFKRLNKSTKLAFHIPSLYLFAIKEKFDEKRLTLFDSGDNNFCVKYSYRYLTPLYGFILNGSKIVGLVYEFMSNGSLDTYMKNNKDKIPRIFSYLSASRILLGIDYLHSKFQVHGNLKPSNILIDHDNLVYISDNMQFTTDQDHDFSKDIYSFGMILYYLFIKKDFYNSYRSKSRKEKFSEWPKDLKDIEFIFKNCVNYKPKERLKLNQIEALLSKASDNFLISNNNISDYKITEIEYNKFACQYIYDLLLLEIQTKKVPNKIFIAEKVYSFFALTLKQSSCYIYLAHIYMNSDNELKNKDKALHFYNLAAKYGNVDALIILGKIYLEGIIEIKDIPKAKEYFKRAVEKGNVEALFLLGEIYWNENKIKEAIDFYKKAACKNDPSALLKLGNLYYDGNVFTKNLQKAKEYYSLASSKKNDEALLMLGDMYYKGEGVKKNYIVALDYYERSYMQNNLFAPYRLGTLYYNGSGVDVNIKKSIEYFNICIHLYDQNNKKYYGACLNGSKNDLGTIYITESECLNKNKSSYLLEQAAKGGEYQHGYNNFAIFNEFYLDDNQNIQRAEDYFKRASDKGFPLSDFNLARLYEKLNQGENALNYYIKASDNENLPFIYNNSQIYDKRLEYSNSFVICYSNLKLTLYYLSKQKINEAKKYFLRALTKQIKISKNCFLCKKDKNIFPFLRNFILDNYEESKLSSNELKKFCFSVVFTSALSQMFSKSNMAQIDDYDDKVKNMFNKTKFDKSEESRDIKDDNNLISDADKFFDFALQNVNSFLIGIYNIILEMNAMLLNPPYRILLGRMPISEEKNHLNQIDDFFYKGIGSDILEMMSVNHIFEYE